MQFMLFSKEKIPGTLLFIAATQFVICLEIAESLYPRFSLSENWISDLGVGPSALIFNGSVILLGVLIISAGFLQRRNSDFKVLNILLTVMAIGTIGIGIFTEDFSYLHGAIAAVAFLFAGLAEIASAKVLKKPLSTISIILGVITILALALYATGMATSGSITSTQANDSIFYLGLGPGGMERMIIYPALMWLAGFGGHLLTKSDMKK